MTEKIFNKFQRGSFVREFAICLFLSLSLSLFLSSSLPLSHYNALARKRKTPIRWRHALPARAFKLVRFYVGNIFLLSAETVYAIGWKGERWLRRQPYGFFEGCQWMERCVGESAIVRVKGRERERKSEIVSELEKEREWLFNMMGKLSLTTKRLCVSQFDALIHRHSTDEKMKHCKKIPPQ